MNRLELRIEKDEILNELRKLVSEMNENCQRKNELDAVNNELAKVVKQKNSALKRIENKLKIELWEK